MLRNKIMASVIASTLFFSGSTAHAFFKPKDIDTEQSQDVKVQPLIRADKEQLDRVYRVKEYLGISGVADHQAYIQLGAVIDKTFDKKIYEKLSTYNDIEDKVGFLTYLNAVVAKKGLRVHLNSNFALELNEEERKYIDTVYTAYLVVLYERTKGLDDKAKRIEFDKMQREAPFEFYESDYEKVRSFMAE